MSVLCCRLVGHSGCGNDREANALHTEIRDMWKGKNSLGKQEEDKGT